MPDSLPTSDELHLLPRGARVAFAVRCAQRVPPPNVCSAAEAAAKANPAIVPYLRRDYELLLAKSRTGGWTDDTPVPPDSLGPLEPNGDPGWWSIPAAPARDGAEGESAFLTRAKRVLAGDLRPSDYLPVPEEVTRAVDEHLNRLAEVEGIVATPKAKQHQLDEWTLMYHHPHDVVLARFTDRGVIVLAAGPGQIGALKGSFKPDAYVGFTLMFPFTE